MLCLSRRRGEQIRIGGDIVVTVLEVRSDGAVRLGIEAPRDVPIYRQEIHPGRPESGAPPGRKDGES